MAETIKYSFLTIAIPHSFVLVIDTNTRVKYLTNVYHIDHDCIKPHMSGLSPLYKADGTLDTVSPEELEGLMRRAALAKLRHYHSYDITRDPVSLHTQEINI